MVNAALPEKYRDYSRTLGKSETDAMLAQLAADDPEKYKDVAFRLVQLGRQSAFEEGTTLRLSDVMSPVDKTPMLAMLDEQESRIDADPNLTDDERRVAREDLYSNVNEALGKLTYDAALANGNMFAMQVKSKARGNRNQLTALLTTPGTYEDAKDRVIPGFIRSSYAEGLKPHEYFSATYGARKGVISCLTPDTLVRMADFSTKRIGDIVVNDVVLGSDKNGVTKPVRVSRVFDNGVQPVYEYSFRRNASAEIITVKATENHKMLARVWRAGKRGTPRVLGSPELSKLGEAKLCKRQSRNNYIAQLSRGCDTSAFTRVNEPRALLLGLMLGDGCSATSTRGQMTFSCADSKIIDNTKDYISSFGLEFHKVCGTNYNWTIRSCIKTGTWTKTADGRMMDNETRAWLWSVTGNLLANEKRIPSCVSTWDSASVAALVAGYLATDGCVVSSDKGRGWISFASTSKQLLAGISDLLSLHFGIWCNPISVTSYRDGSRLPLHQLSITHPDCLAAFKQCIKVPGVKLDKLMSLNTAKTVRCPSLGCRINDIRYMGMLPVVDIEVDDPDHMFVLANGLISSNSKFATRDAGYLGKLMGAAVIDEVVSESDCGTPYGLPVPADDDDNIGTVLSRPTAGFSAGTVITKDVMDKIKAKKIDTIVVRSPLTCGSKAGVCKHCVGMREGNKFPELGYHAGLSASQAIAEPIAQMGLNVKHSGKKAKGQTTYSGFKVLKNMATVPATYPDSATASELDGRVTKIDAAAQGGWHVYIGDVAHYVPHDKPLLVKEGDDVEAGDQLSDGVVNPSDVVRLKGLGEGRRYFTERFTRAMRDSNININRRNVELLSRALVNHVQVDDMDDDGGHLPGDVVQYGSWAFGHKPRKDSVRLDPRKAIGKYLDEPALHYTIGTRITKSVADRLANTGTMDVLAAQKAPGVSPVMVSVVRTPEYTDDWMARLGTSYLKTRLLEDVHSGSTSNLHGVNPLPGIAKGVEFGVNKPGAKTFTY